MKPKTNEIFHLVAAAGSGLKCLNTGALYYTSIDNCSNPEFIKKVFSQWDIEYGAKHFAATGEEICKFEKRRNLYGQSNC